METEVKVWGVQYQDKPHMGCPACGSLAQDAKSATSMVEGSLTLYECQACGTSYTRWIEIKEVCCGR